MLKLVLYAVMFFYRTHYVFSHVKAIEGGGAVSLTSAYSPIEMLTAHTHPHTLQAPSRNRNKSRHPGL
jgi:hypothetical protein